MENINHHPKQLHGKSTKKEGGLSKNVGDTERMVSTVAGGALLAYGLKRRDAVGIALSILGGGLAFRGTTGHCAAYQAMDINTAQGEAAGGNVEVEKSVTINKSANELFKFWRNLENLPKFMNHLESVKNIDNKRSHWKAKAPLGQNVEWDAEITGERENEFISWSSTEESEVPNSGRVEFKETKDRGTELKVKLTYQPPAGKLGALVAKLFGEEPNQQIAEDLRRLKQLMESGTIMTVEGQTSGRESKAGKAAG